MFLARLYASIQVLLFSILNTEAVYFGSAVLVVVNILLIISAARNRWNDYNIYVSQQVLHNSGTFLVIGLYLIFLGLIVKVANYFNFGNLFIEYDFVYLVGLLGALVLLFSENVR